MMRGWLQRLGVLEIRESTDSYTDALIAARLRTAEGGLGSGTTAAIEAAIGLWSRAFMAARSDRLGADVLGAVGRALLAAGESLWLINGTTVIPVCNWTVTGRGQWLYKVEVPFPSGSQTVDATETDVLHFRIGQTQQRPWAGVSPLTRAGLTCEALSRIEGSLSAEFGGPVGHVLPVPSVSKELAGDVSALRGNTVLGETTAGGWGEGRAGAPARDWQPSRIGPSPGASTGTLREGVERSVLAAAGVPVELAGGQAVGNASREAWRRFLHGTMQPVGRIVGLEIQGKLGGSGEIDFRALMASDLAGRARAFKSLTESGMSEPDARVLCGF